MLYLKIISYASFPAGEEEYGLIENSLPEEKRHESEDFETSEDLESGRLDTRLRPSLAFRVMASPRVGHQYTGQQYTGQQYDEQTQFGDSAEPLKTCVITSDGLAVLLHVLLQLPWWRP